MRLSLIGINYGFGVKHLPMDFGVTQIDQKVFGDLSEDGYSIRWLEKLLEADQQFFSEGGGAHLQIQLNFTGSAHLNRSGENYILNPSEVAIECRQEEDNHHWVRRSGAVHRFFLIRLRLDFLHRVFDSVWDGLRPEIRAFASGTTKVSPPRVESIPGTMLALRNSLLNPPVNLSAHRLWYRSKITEVLSHFLFLPDANSELFCERHHRINRERCERVLFLLERDMENPPSLQMLADEVGCSPFHLSRIFQQEFGVGIPKALRRVRIERAARLIQEEGLSITESAMQVGYSSLGAFNKGFLEQFGCTPSQYAKKTATTETSSQ